MPASVVLDLWLTSELTARYFRTILLDDRVNLDEESVSFNAFAFAFAFDYFPSFIATSSFSCSSWGRFL